MSYGSFAAYYDRLMGDTPYGRWCDYFEKIWEKQKKKVQTVVDLGCGTGEITLRLAKRGYEMIGVDLSEEMLARARQKGTEAKADVLWLNQDICSLDLYGTVDGAVSSLDTINYITDKRRLLKCFERVHLFLEPGGCFIFDINSPYKFEKVLGRNSFAYDYSDLFCLWQNFYDPKTRLCEFDLTVFEWEGENFSRYDERQQERCYHIGECRDLLLRAGFAKVSVWRPFALRAPGPRCERIFFAARKA